jgi:CRP/FNR family transcriptional regulator, cyclic AMP receptor protein
MLAPWIGLTGAGRQPWRLAMDFEPENSLDDARRLLANCMLFRGLVTDERDAIVGRARMRHFAAGETIFLMGSPGTSMMAVLAGTIRISVPSPDGREIVLAILQAGEVFGEMALLDGGERTADARAMTGCDLAVLERHSVMEFLERRPDAWPRLVKVLCERLRTTDLHIAEVAMQELPVRLARVLLRSSESQNPRPAGSAVATINVSQRELGNIVGAARESVNKCLREWQRTAMVRVNGASIAILDAARLKRISEQGRGPA